MTWFDEFKKDLKEAGYVRLVCDFHVRERDGKSHGNMEAFYYLNQKTPGSDRWGLGTHFWDLLGSEYYKSGKYKIGGGAGNGHEGVHQHQVTIPAEMVLPELDGFTIWDLVEDVNTTLLPKAIFSYFVDVPCRRCGMSVTESAYTKREPLVCTSCVEGDD